MESGGESDRSRSIKRGIIRNFFLYKWEQKKIEQNTIKTNWHKFLTAISDGNQKLSVIKSDSQL